MIFKKSGQRETFTREKCYISELLNDPRIPNLSLAVARVEPGTTTELHELDVDEAYYILQGLGMMRINGEIAGDVEKGDVVFIGHEKTQQITNTGDDDLLFLCICIPRFAQQAYHTQ